MPAIVFDNVEKLPEPLQRINELSINGSHKEIIKCNNDEFKSTLPPESLFVFYYYLSHSYDELNQTEESLEYLRKSQEALLSIKEIPAHLARIAAYVLIEFSGAYSYELSDVDTKKKFDDDTKQKFDKRLKWALLYTNSCRSEISVLLTQYKPINANTIDSLVRQYFYLAKYDELNDPMEFLTDSGNAILSGMLKKTRIACFSDENHDPNYMYTHFADQHKGIRIDYQIAFGLRKEPTFGMHTVKYDQDPDHFMGKFDCYRFEGERRLFTFVEDKDRIFYGNPYTGENFVYAHVKRITFGCRTPEAHKEMLYTLLRHRRPYIYFFEEKVAGKRLKQQRYDGPSMEDVQQAAWEEMERSHNR